MNYTHVSRRTFTLLAGALSAAEIPLPGQKVLTVQDVVQRIQSSLGGDWPANGLDGLRAGDPNTPVKGIATTAMATMDVLRQAARAGTNLIVTYEPTFFGRQDGRQPAPGGRGPGGIAPGDPVYKAKKEFIEKNGLVVFRLCDKWQSRKESDMTTALAESLGWANYRVKRDDILYDIPATTAEDAVALIRTRLSIRGGLRAVGERNAKVRRVMLYPGSMSTAIFWQRYPEVDLVIAGEVREWENTFYAADIFTEGGKRGLVTIGRVVSEDPGMRACADWLKTIVQEIPTRWIAAGDLYWRAV